MTFPVIGGAAAQTSGALTSAALTINLPASIVAGDLLICLFARAGGSQTVTFPSGWTKVVDNVAMNAGNTNGHIAYKRIVAGSAEIGASTMSLTSTVTTSQSTVADVQRWTLAGSQIEAGTFTNGTASPNPPLLTPALGAVDYTWLAGSFWADSRRIVSTYPTGYNSDQSTINDGSTLGKVALAYGSKQANAASDNPAAMSISNSADNLAFVIAIWPATSYTLTAAVGAFTVSGVAALKKITKIAAVGAFAVNGIAALKKISKKADVGAFALTGIANAMRPGKIMIAALGTFAVTGIAAALKPVRSMIAGTGAFAVSGVATLKKLTMIAVKGTFTFTGVAALSATTRRLIAAVGTFSLAGIAAALPRGRVLTAALGTFALTGIATLKKISMKAVTGAFALSGPTTILRSTRRMVAAVGTFTLTGVAAFLRAGRTLTAAVGTFTVTGRFATLARKLVVVSGKVHRVVEPTLAKLRSVDPVLTLRRSVAPTLAKLRARAPFLFK